MAKILFTILFFLNTPGSLAQKTKSTFISYELGLTFDNISFSSNDPKIRMLNNRSGTTGLLITHEIKNHLFIELGIYDKFIGADFPSYNPDTSNLVFAVNSIQLPLRVGFRKPFFNNKIITFLTAGISYYLTHSFKGVIYSGASNNVYIEETPIGKNFYTFDLGFLINYFASDNFAFGIAYRHTHRFKNIADYAVSVTKTNGSITDYRLRYAGVTNNILLNVQYRISSLWD